jgi:16S rRNA (cytosine1402-N4)-methyltransferase
MIHIPVLLRETMEILNVMEDGTYVDATVGLGGHAREILSKIGDRGVFAGIDRDDMALRHSREQLGNNRAYFCKGSFSELEGILGSLNIKQADGVLFDLGVSMLQLKELSRGFSFLSHERLDMRMDATQRLTAWDVVNRYHEKDLARILREYGEEPLAWKITKALIARRKKTPLNTCAELADFVAGIYGGRGKMHPATRTFQALRIEVNRELDELKKGLAAAVSVLGPGGRLAVISYHSLEDRIVKNFLRDSGHAGLLRVLTKKPVTASPDEVRRNPSSRSAKLRGAEKI